MGGALPYPPLCSMQHTYSSTVQRRRVRCFLPPERLEVGSSRKGSLCSLPYSLRSLLRGPPTPAFDIQSRSVCVVTRSLSLFFSDPQSSWLYPSLQLSRTLRLPHGRVQKSRMYATVRFRKRRMNLPQGK